MLDIIWEKIADEWFMSTVMAWALLITMLILHLEEVIKYLDDRK